MSAPTLITSIPARATSATRSSVTPPETSSSARPRARSAATRTSSSEKLSSMMMSAPTREGLVELIEAVDLDLDARGVGRVVSRLAERPPVIPPAATMWLSLISTALPSVSRWLCPPPARTAYRSSARRPGVVLRVSVMRVAQSDGTSSTNARVSVAIPDMRCAKFSATRSAVRMLRALPSTRQRTASGARPRAVWLGPLVHRSSGSHAERPRKTDHLHRPRRVTCRGHGAGVDFGLDGRLGGQVSTGQILEQGLVDQGFVDGRQQHGTGAYTNRPRRARAELAMHCCHSDGAASASAISADRLERGRGRGAALARTPRAESTTESDPHGMRKRPPREAYVASPCGSRERFTGTEHPRIDSRK